MTEYRRIIPEERVFETRRDSLDDDVDDCVGITDEEGVWRVNLCNDLMK